MTPEWLEMRMKCFWKNLRKLTKNQIDSRNHIKIKNLINMSHVEATAVSRMARDASEMFLENLRESTKNRNDSSKYTKIKNLKIFNIFLKRLFKSKENQKL